MALTKRQAAVVQEIAKEYSGVLDLKKSPAMLIEILRNYGRVVDDDGGEGADGVSPSLIAVAGPPPPPPPPSEAGDVRLEDAMRAVLNLQRDVSAINRSLSSKTAKQAR